MARKGCGPYNLGAPKAVAKQIIKDPKSGNEVVTRERGEQNGIKGTWVHRDVTTPGTGGANIEIIKPNKTMRQAYDDALTKGYRKPEESFESYSARAKAEIPSRASSTKRTSRFTPDSPKLTAQPIKPFSPEMPKAEGIKPPKKVIDLNAPSGKYFYKKDVNKKFGSSSVRGRSSSAVQGPNFGDKDYGNVTKSRPMTQREEMLLGTDIARKTGGATASPYGQGGEEGFQNYLSQVESKLKERTAKLKARSSNKKVKSAAYKMKGYMSNFKK